MFFEENTLETSRRTLTKIGFGSIVKKVPRGLRNSKPPKK
jgi:hypothetical protein